MPCLHGYRSAVEQAGGTVLEVQYLSLIHI